ncbi:MAG: hypothetical protein JWO56_2470, partial [Acidobacteria bacterium]|nr:hypothetical protein [Acidobacteriota bacterium]
MPEMQKLAFLAIAAIAVAIPVRAVEPLAAVAPVALHRASGPIAIDGDLTDAGWQGAATIDIFYETSPGDNTPPAAKTVAFVTYDDHALYIGIHAYDPEPAKIRAPYVDRDQVFGTDDNIAVFLDTRNDRRSAIELRVNPRGIQGDAVFNDANQNEDFSPDYFYDTAAKIGSDGWTAEYRVPFSSLRYSNADPQTWGILIWRNYPRAFRYAYHSAPIARGSNCFVCHSHELTGLSGLPAAGHFVAAPYVTAQGLQHPEGELGTPFESDPVKIRTGIDVKYNPTADHTVDLTLNPDFSQIELDVAQITVNQRFAVFFPEKRPFFLEGFDLFATPLQVAYTRTITAPRWGLRSTGKIGATAYTVLVSQDKGGGLVILPGPTGSQFALQDFKSLATIGRLRRDYGTSFVGAILTDRENRGGGHNRLFGPDFQWRPTESDSITGQLLVSQTVDRDHPDRNGSSHALDAIWNRNLRNYDMQVELKDIGDRFRADLGFLPQVGYREAFGQFGRHFYPENRWLAFVRTNVNADYQTDLDGNVIFRQLLLGTNVIGFKNLQAFFSIRPQEQVRVAGRLLEQTYGTFFAQIDPNRRFARIVVQGRTGDSIDYENARVGRGTTIGISAVVRPLDRLELALDTNREWLDARGSRVFLAQVERLKTTYSFSAKSLVRVIGQYVSTTRDPAQYRSLIDRHEGSFNGSILYSYKINWQTVLFAGYGDDRLLTPENRLLKQDRSLFLKVSYALQH